MASNSMDSGQKPFEAFTHAELDRYYGEVKDHGAEVKEIVAEDTLEQQVEQINHYVFGILQRCLAQRVFDRSVIVVNSKWRQATEKVAKHYGLHVAVHPEFPEDEIFIEHVDNLEKIISSRIAKKKGYMPSVLLSGIRKTA